MTNEEYGELYSQACELLEADEYDKAEEICNQLIKFNNKQAPVFNLLASINDKKGDIKDAIENMNLAIKLDKNNYLYYYNIGEFYKKSGKLDLALEKLEKSEEINPYFDLCLYTLGNIHSLLKNNGEAEKYFEKVIEINPNFYQAMNNLGLLYMESFYLKEAEAYYKKALEIVPNDADINLNLGLASIYLKKISQSEKYLKKALEVNPLLIPIYKMLANVLITLGKIDDARTTYEKYLTLLSKTKELSNPHIECIKLKIDLLSTQFFFNDTEINNHYKIMEKCTQNKIYSDDKNFVQFIFENAPILHGYYSYTGVDNKEIKKKFANIFKNNFPVFNPSFNSGKIKIGFLVGKTFEKLFARFNCKLINFLLLNNFDVYIICDRNGWNNILKKIIDKNVKTIFLSVHILECANKIKDANLDILYYWETCNEELNYFLPFFRLAPIQCTGIGWPDTTGIDTMDYFISSELIEIENSHEHYSEKLIKMQELPLYLEEPKIEKVYHLNDFKKYGLTEKNKIYFCNQNIRKIHHDFDYLIFEILKKDLNGVIVFIKDHDEIIYQLLKSRLMSKNSELFNRIIFTDNLLYDEFLSLTAQSDVILDTLYFGGANSAYDSFAMNVPIVTLPWTHERGRYVYGCYKKMGIEGLIADTFEDYIDLSVRTANDYSFRNKTVNEISMNKHKLFENSETLIEYKNIFTKLCRN